MINPQKFKSYKDAAQAALKSAAYTRNLSERLYRVMLLSDLAGHFEAFKRREPNVLQEEAFQGSDRIVEGWMKNPRTKKLAGTTTGIFEGEWSEALFYFRKKVPMTSEQFAALDDMYKGIVFGTKTLMGLDQSMQYAILQDMKTRIDDALAHGTPFDDWKASVVATMKSNGLTDLLPDYRLKLIFQQNVMNAYASGNWHQLNSINADIPLVYLTAQDNRVRPSHLQWQGFTRPKSDPIWKKIWPPNGFACRCRVCAADKDDLKNMKSHLGGDVSDIPEGFRSYPGAGFRIQVPHMADIMQVRNALENVK